MDCHPARTHRDARPRPQGAGEVYSVSKSPGCGGASGVNSQRSGLMSSSGVSSRQSRPRTRMTLPSIADQLDDRGADRIGPHRRAQREGAAGFLVVLRALQHEVAARLVQPVDHFEILVEIDALDRGHPGLEDLQPADRAIVPALPRRLQPRGPGRADAADEDEPGIARLAACRRRIRPRGVHFLEPCLIQVS